MLAQDVPVWWATVAPRGWTTAAGVPTPGAMDSVRAMAMHPDPLADTDYRSFLQALAREGLPHRVEAVRATEAVACALAWRLADPDFEPLLQLLPAPFRGHVAPCERHTAAPPAPPAPTLEAFHGRVAEDLGAREDLETTVRAVFAALRAQLSDDAAEEIGQRLPAELAPLWSLTS